MPSKQPPPFITSPYNFAPLPNKVVHPDWAEKVSHDVPFSDGISGTLEIELEAKTPVYVRSDQESLEDGERKADDGFFALGKGGNYAIPGTSLKGTIRSVLSIASHGKMSQAHDSLFSYRDLSNARNEYLRYFNGMKNSGSIQAGWIMERGEEWMLYPCPMARLLKQQEVERQLQVSGFERAASDATAKKEIRSL